MIKLFHNNIVDHEEQLDGCLAIAKFGGDPITKIEIALAGRDRLTVDEIKKFFYLLKSKLEFYGTFKCVVKGRNIVITWTYRKGINYGTRLYYLLSMMRTVWLHPEVVKSFLKLCKVMDAQAAFVMACMKHGAFGDGKDIIPDLVDMIPLFTDVEVDSGNDLWNYMDEVDDAEFLDTIVNELCKG